MQVALSKFFLKKKQSILVLPTTYLPTSSSFTDVLHVLWYLENITDSNAERMSSTNEVRKISIGITYFCFVCSSIAVQFAVPFYLIERILPVGVFMLVLPLFPKNIELDL